MSGSSAGSARSLRSRGPPVIDPFIPQGLPPPRSRKKAATWTVEEEATLLNFLYSNLGQVADGNFKKVTWNATAAHMARYFPPSENAGDKTAEACECKFKMLKKYYYAVADLKCVASGFAYDDIQGAMITLENADLWDRYTKVSQFHCTRQPDAKPFRNLGFSHFQSVELLLPSSARGRFV
ncbi:hypothetical protein PISMIDRAFT_112461, partial [Pisolithus microcarpus 441]